MKKEMSKKEKREYLSRKKLVEAAKIFFSKNGYKTTSVDQIAEEALLSKGTFYKYFTSKENLFLATLQETRIDLIETIDDKIINRSFRNAGEMFRELTFSILEYFEKDHYFIQLSLYRIAEFNEEIIAAMRETQLYLRNKLVQVFNRIGIIDDQKANAFALTFIGALYLHSSYWYFNSQNGNPNIQGTVNALVEQFSPYLKIPLKKEEVSR